MVLKKICQSIFSLHKQNLYNYQPAINKEIIIRLFRPGTIIFYIISTNYCDEWMLIFKQDIVLDEYKS